MKDTTAPATGRLCRLQLDIPAQQPFLKVLGACVSALFQQESLTAAQDAAYRVHLAVHELCINILEHAYGEQDGRIRAVFTITENPGSFTVDLRDSGRSFVLPDAAFPDPSNLQVRGYGLALIHQLMDHVSYHPSPGDNHWRLVKYL
ncbi:MAG: ATP-binding protein [Chloroflexi bacterium]|nr:ATP-binding protein [Chloroflexota bacterium]